MNPRSSSKWHEPYTDFDFASVDTPDSLGLDTEFWHAQAELLGDLLRWVTIPHSLAGMGARLCVLVLYLNPRLINKTSLAEISRMRGAPTRAALSKAMLQFQARYALNPSYYQKAGWMRARYQKSAFAAHLNQPPPLPPDAPQTL
jgi:hypothetical protein